MEDKLFNIAEAAHYFGGVSEYTIHSWLSKGKLRRTKIGSRTMIRLSELERFAKEGEGQKSPGRNRA